ncbi:hypothetical protein HGRIS_009762 [Hohenbuehelia grisea]|uniref:Phospholipid/glycerol acyltransferase domain-containing protein n=1 Tax=Hohenbuehelia grisea TaxID=104357 RepID=A0ABR3J2C5_9AGAR
MEKFSAYRDPGTGIQPFLNPVPPIGSDALATVALPFGYALAVIRTVLVVALSLLYVVLVNGLCLVFLPVPPLYRLFTRILTAVITRTILFIVGLFWIPVEIVTRKRGKGKHTTNSWNPSAGDIIVSNWVSWIEVLWLSYRFNPIFAVPVFDPPPSPAPAQASSPITHTPGRRTGTGSANISTAARAPLPRAQFRGFRVVSLLQMVMFSGRAPPYGDGDPQDQATSLENIRSKANAPIVVFPESTTSNGRGLLRLANVFPNLSVPIKDFNVFVMCVRYDPPTSITPSMAIPIPSSVMNPLGHVFRLSTSLVPLTISIRLLEPSDSPSSQLFIVSEIATDAAHDGLFTEVCAALMAQLGKMKRTGMGWEEKAAFLEFYRSKKH